LTQNSAQTNRQTDKPTDTSENNGHLAVNQHHRNKMAKAHKK